MGGVRMPVTSLTDTLQYTVHATLGGQAGDIAIMVNLPDLFPLIPQDDQYEDIVVPGTCKNENFPRCTGKIRLLHYHIFPLVGGTSVPNYGRGSEFLLICPTGKLDDGRLLYLG